MSSTKVLTASLLAFTIAGTGAEAQTQGYESFRRQTGQALTNRTDESGSQRERATDFRFRNKKDSLDWAKNKAIAEKSTGFRIVVSLQEAHLWVVIDEDTLLSAPVSVASGKTLTYQGRSYTFETPRGQRKVLDKDADPIWQPPEWLYYETAAELGLRVKPMPSKGLTMPNGKRLFVNERNEVGVIDSIGPTDFPKDLHIIFDDVLYIPPMGTENRKVNGTLGKYKLVLGEGYLLHGTPHKNSIGMRATHGCIRLRDEDIEWLYENIPVGTKVYIY